MARAFPIARASLAARARAQRLDAAYDVFWNKRFVSVNDDEVVLSHYEWTAVKSVGCLRHAKQGVREVCRSTNRIVSDGLRRCLEFAGETWIQKS